MAEMGKWWLPPDLDLVTAMKFMNAMYVPWNACYHPRTWLVVSCSDFENFFFLKPSPHCPWQLAALMSEYDLDNEEVTSVRELSSMSDDNRLLAPAEESDDEGLLSSPIGSLRREDTSTNMNPDDSTTVLLNGSSSPPPINEPPSFAAPNFTPPTKRCS